MRVIGIVGGVASGKSLVSAEFRRLGARVLDADRAGHEVLEEEPVRQALRDRWGAAVFDRQGKVDREAIARIVFAPPPDGPPERRFLEGLTHPRIRGRLQDEAVVARESGLPAVVLDAALLLEAGWDRLCDVIVFVAAPRTARLERSLRRGWTEQQFAAREAAQMSLEEKQSRASQTIDNSGSAAETVEQVRRLWHSWVAQTANSPEANP
ncbi:MAG: dephospho-CoA kinase [Pirellulaceae bacterium]|nr:dephospho-CoA kinase [Pirellulaceae bacterium]